MNVILTPPHLAGMTVTATVRPPDGSGPAYYVLDREHPDRPGEHLTVGVEDSTTVELSARPLDVFRARLAAGDEPEEALDATLRGRGSSSITVRVGPAALDRYTVAAGGRDKVAAWMRSLADAASRHRDGRP